MESSPVHADDTASIALLITSRRHDLAAVCLARALAELLEEALSEQIRHSPAPLQSWRNSGPQFDPAVIDAFLVRPLALDARGRYCELECRAIGALEQAMCETGLGSRIRIRIASQKLEHAYAGRRQRVGRVELVHPVPVNLWPDNPALCLLLDMLDGRSRIHAWRPG